MTPTWPGSIRGGLRRAREWFSRSLSRLRIVQKLPIALVGVSLLAVTVTGTLAYRRSSEELSKVAGEKLLALLSARKLELDSYLATIAEDVRLFASSEMITGSLTQFAVAYASTSPEALQRRFSIEHPEYGRNEPAIGSAAGASLYGEVHATFDHWWAEVARSRGYRDLFLIDANGNVVYSATKESDFATNLETGPWRDTDLASIFRRVRSARRPDLITFTDFRPYAPSAHSPTAFMAAPIRYGPDLIGALAVQIPIERISRIMQVAAGMGQSGETILVGNDHLMRSNSRFSVQPTILRTSVDTRSVRRALQGETAVEYAVGRDGTPVLSAFAPFDFAGVRWAMIAEVATAEVLAPVRQMGHFMLLAGLLISAIAATIGFFYSRTITRPLVAMTSAMVRLARGDQAAEIPAVRRLDEIGDMTAAIRVFKEHAEFAALVELTNDAIFTATVDGRISSWNTGAESIYGFSRDEIIDQPLQVLEPAHLRQKHQALRARILRGESAVQYETRGLRKDGHVFDVSLTLSLITDKYGHVSGISTVARDISEQKLQARRLQDAVRARDTFLKEVHHRVRNNLQMISSMLNLQARDVTDTAVRAKLEDTRRRVLSMGVTYDLMLRSDKPSEISFLEHAGNLVELLRKACPTEPEVDIAVEGDDIVLDLDTAIRLGMIINEVVTNALKHAFGGRSHGLVEIRMSYGGDGSDATLTIRDDGKGLPPGFDYRRSKSFGIKIIRALCRELRATVDFDSGAGGTEVKVRFTPIRSGGDAPRST